MIKCPFCSSTDTQFKAKAGRWECQACEERFDGTSPSGSPPLPPGLSDNAAMPKRIFFSYGHDANRELVDRFKADLEDRGHQVWIDYKEIGTWDDWKGAITRGIHDAQLAIAFLSIHSTRDPGVCRNEVAMALQHFGKVYPVLVEEVPRESIPVTIAHLQWPDLSRWQEFRDQEDLDFERFYEEKFLEIVSRVEGEAGRFASEAEVLRRALNPSGFEGRFARHLDGFTGREWVFDEFEHWLDRQPSSRVFWIKAGPGFGKTALAVQMANRHRAAIVGTWFCDHQSVELRDPLRAVQTIAYQLALRWDDYRVRLLPRLGLFADSSPERIEEARKELAKKSLQDLFSFLISEPMAGLIWREHKLVILVDALDEAADADGTNPLAALISGRFLELPEWIGFVVTSRPDPSVVPYLQCFKPFSIEAGDARNTADLHAYCSTQVGPLLAPDDSEALCDLLVEKSEGMMLYLRLVAEGLREGTLDPGGLDSLAAGLPGLHSRYHAVFESRFRKDYEKTIQPLLRLVMAAPGPMPLDLVREVLGWDRETAVRALTLVGSYLVEDVGGLSLFHKTLGEWLGSENAGIYCTDAKPAAKRLGDFLWECFDQREKGQYDLTRSLRWEQQVIYWLPKLLDLTDRKEDWEEIADLSSWFYERMLWDQTEVIYWFALKGQEKALGEKHPDTLPSFIGLVKVLSDKGDYDNAASLCRDRLKKMEAAMGILHSATLSLVVIYLELLKEAGADTEAETMRRRVLDKVDSLGWLTEPISEWPEFKETHGHIAWILNDNGDFRKAEALYRKALLNVETSNTQNISVVSHLSQCIGVVLNNQRNINGAMEFFLKALAASEEAMGSNHFETLECLSNVTEIFEKKKDFEKAEEYHKRVLQGYEKTYGAKSYAKISYANTLGNFYKGIGRYQEAALIYKNCIEIGEKTLGSEVPFMLGLAFNLGLVTQEMNDLSEAEIQYRKVFKGREKILGLTHEDTLMSLETLADLLKEKGDFDGSLKFFNNLLQAKIQKDPEFSNTSEFRRILKEIITLRYYPWAIGYIDKTIFSIDGVAYSISKLIRHEIRHGRDNPEFQESLMELGNCMQDRGEYLNAEGLYRRAFEIRSRILGPDHELTLASASRLAWRLWERGGFEELEPLSRYEYESDKVKFGDFDTITSESAVRLGEVLEKLEKYNEAKALYSKVLPVIEATLSSHDRSHNFNSSSFSKGCSVVEKNLIPLMRKLGESKEAEILSNQISEYKKMALDG
jgi:tetratricopeptide (TPR) repeat protein